jgi:hypothetical protein
MLRSNQSVGRSFEATFGRGNPCRRSKSGVSKTEAINALHQGATKECADSYGASRALPLARHNLSCFKLRAKVVTPSLCFESTRSNISRALFAERGTATRRGHPEA